MPLPTEPIGSVPRPQELLDGIREFDAGHISRGELDALYDRATRDTIERFEATGLLPTENRRNPVLRPTRSMDSRHSQRTAS